MSVQCAFCLMSFPTVTSRMNHEEACDVFSTEKLCWYACEAKLPDDGEAVLMFGSAFDEVREGYIEAGTWHLPDAHVIDGEITHWARMPFGPSL